MKVKVWTTKEDNTLLDNIKNAATRIEAFVNTSKKIERSEGACAERWRVLKKDLPENFFDTQGSIEAIVEDATSTEIKVEYDVISEINKIIEDNKFKTAQVVELTTLVREKEGTIFDLEFQLSQNNNDRENLEYQVEQFAALVETSMSEQTKYIEENRKLESQKEIHESKLKKLQEKLDGSEAMITHYKKENERLKNEKEEYMNENNTIMNLFNKARKMFTGTDKDEVAKFKMERNGNLERIG
jgi:chromosome segregation ATPase